MFGENVGRIVSPATPSLSVAFDCPLHKGSAVHFFAPTDCRIVDWQRKSYQVLDHVLAVNAFGAAILSGIVFEVRQHLGK